MRLPCVRFLVGQAAYEHQVKRQVILELTLFLVVSLGLTMYNSAVYDFPLESGLKIVLGCGALGFFAAMDLALARERFIYEEFIRIAREFADREEAAAA